MTFLFSTPRRHRLAAAVFFAATIGNTLIFNDTLHFYTSGGEPSSQGIFAIVVHLATVVLFGLTTGRLAAMGGQQERFIKMMERNGFTYNPRTREFRPDGNTR
ncbi:hypothetical protein Q6670_004027 [Salmonella enterica]|nr:hypothetical protein [Salmonella enterica]